MPTMIVTEPSIGYRMEIAEIASLHQPSVYPEDTKV